MTHTSSFTPSERRALRSLNTPEKIQGFLDKIPYHLADTAWSPRRVLRERTAHCLEGAVFAAAALQLNGHLPLILDLEADNDTDHVIAVYRQAGAWGAIASSNYSTCRFRSPVYRTLRELALSYFEGYFNPRGQRSLRTFSRPVNLSRFDVIGWRITEKPIWFIAEHLCDIPHRPLLKPGLEKNLSRVDARTFASEMVGHQKKPKLTGTKKSRPGDTGPLPSGRDKSAARRHRFDPAEKA